MRLHLLTLRLPRDARCLPQRDRSLYHLGNVDPPGAIGLFDHQIRRHRYAYERHFSRRPLKAE
jgi:hypothetical protein